MLWRSPAAPGRSSRAPASFISPCLPTFAERPPTGPARVHEIKHDGYRLQIHIRAGSVRLFTRTGVDWSDRYPWIAQGAARLPVRQAIIDAECCWRDSARLIGLGCVYIARVPNVALLREGGVVR